MKLHKWLMQAVGSLALLCLTGLLPSCKKTELVAYNRLPQNTILEYKVTNAADTLLGAIDNVNNTITVYVPYYLGIDYLVPNIKIGENAKLLNAAGEVINLDGGVPPVPVDTTGYSYIVAGGDSVKRRYNLIIQIAPHPDSLKAGYQLNTTGVDYTSALECPVFGRIALYGNFGSTSNNATFTLTNQVTGKVYDNVFSVYEITPGNNYYTMMLDISPDADSGYYNVQLKHQGRTASLPPVHLVYNKPKINNVKSLSAYAPGDTVVFSVVGRSTAPSQNGVLIGLQKVYMKFTKTGFNYGGSYPATFPDTLFDKQLEMKIISQSRSEVKVLFPDVPQGAVGDYVYAGFTVTLPAVGFYFNFSDETGWGSNNPLATTGRYFTIKPKK